MTVVQNTELTPDNQPIPGVTVVVATSVPAATATGTGTVVGDQTVRSDSAGNWSLDLIPNQSGLEPAGVWYVVTRHYPRSYKPDGTPQVDAIVVPSSTSPVTFESCLASNPIAAPLTDSELQFHLLAADPHPQYLTQGRGDARYEPLGGGSGGPPSGAAGGDLQGSYPSPTLNPTAVTSHGLDEMATPQADVAMGSHKLTGLATGTAATDSMNVGQLTSHKGDTNDPHAAAAYAIMVGGGRRVWAQDSTPTSVNVHDGDIWVGNGNVMLRKAGVWTAETGAPATTSPAPTPVSPSPTQDTDRNAEIKSAVNEFFAEYVRSDGAVLQMESDNKIVSEGQAYALLMAVLINDQAKYDLVNSFAIKNLQRSLNNTLTTGKTLWAWSYSVASSTVNDWNWASDAEYDRAMAYMRAAQLWGRQSDFDNLNALIGDLKTYTLNYDQGRAYQTTDGFQQQVGSGLTLGHHTNGSGGYVWESNLSYCNPVAYRMLKAYTGDTVWDQALNGYYDLLTKSTDTSGGLSTTAGLPPDWSDYSTDTHDVGPLTSGTNGWTYTRSTDYGYNAFRAVHRVYADWIIYNEARAKTWLSGAFATFMRNEWTAHSTFGDGYTHTGTKNSFTAKLIFAYAAYEAIVTANPSDGVATTIKSTWLLPVATTNSFGTYLRDDPPSVTPTSTYFGNAWMIFCESMDVGTFNTIATIPGITGKYNTTPPPSTTPTGGGTTGGTTTPGGTAIAPPLTGSASLWVDTNSQIQGYTSGLPSGTKKTRFQWLAGVGGQSVWTGPEWDASGTTVAAASTDARNKDQWLSVAVYGIVNRDLGGSSAGGSAGASQYQNWINAVATGIGTAKCVVVFEPDSIPQMVQAVKQGSKTQADLDARTSLMQQAIVKIRSTCPNVRIYVDAGHSAWFPDPSDLVPALQACGLANCNGIAANVSNFRNDGEVIPWAKGLLGKLSMGPNFGYVWDTGRNGKNPAPAGADYENPLQTQIGRLPQYGGSVVAGDSLAHGCLWVKRQGESDGNSTASGLNSHGGPAAGVFWPSYLYEDSVADNSNGDPNATSLDGSGNAGMLQRPPTPGVAIGGGTTTTPTGGGTTTPPPASLLPTINQSPSGDVANVWGGMKSRYLRTDGGILASAAYDVVSEGQGYGVKVAVQLNDKATFNQIETFNKGQLERHNNGALTTALNLMGWAWSISGGTQDWNWAADADLDRAVGKLWAYYRWYVAGGDSAFSSQLSEATAILNQLKTYSFAAPPSASTPYTEVINGMTCAYLATDSFQIGRTNGGAVPAGISEIDLSYPDASAFKLAKHATGDAFWDNAVNGYYVLCQKSSDNAGTWPTSKGLFPDFCSYLFGTKDIGQVHIGVDGWTYDRGTSSNDYGIGFTYDAFRIVHRMFWDAWWYGEQRAKDLLTHSLENFYRSEYDANNPVSSPWNAPIAAEYKHDGSVVNGNRYEKTAQTFGALWAFALNGDSSRYTGLKNSKLSGLLKNGDGTHSGWGYLDAPGGAFSYYNDFWTIQLFMTLEGSWRNWGQ